VGASWADGTWRAGLVVLYAADIDGDVSSSSGAASGSYAPRGQAFGYEAGVETPLPGGLSLKAERSVEPVAFDAAGALVERLDPDFTPLFAADGRVNAERESLTLSHDSGGVRTSAQWVRGGADGTIAQIFPFEVPLQLLADRRLEYAAGRVGVRVASTGTDVQAEYRRVEDVASAGPIEERTTQEFVELRVVQDLLRAAPLGTSWRLLLAARTSPTGQHAGEGASSSAGAKSLAALNRRVAAGVSVIF
jgi:hypothetical protein